MRRSGSDACARVGAMALNSVTVQVGLPFGLGSIQGEWTPDELERDAAWDMYVEMITRVTVVELRANEGLLREALASFYSLFETTRRILKDGGPSLAGGEEGRVNFAHIAISILNSAVRPLLATWHPQLEDHEAKRPPATSRLEWESQWEHNDELRSAIGEVRDTLSSYAGLLGHVCGAHSLLSLTKPGETNNPSSTNE